LSLLAAYRNLPRAGRWGVVACLGLLAYFAVVEPVVTHLGRLNHEAKTRSAELVGFSRESQALGRTRSSVELGQKYFGEVAAPGDSASRVEVFNRRIAEVLERHGVRDSKTTARRSSMSKGPLLASLGNGAAVSREFSDLQFEATPEQVTAIVADLEKVPEVAGVSRVQLRRVDDESGSRLLRASISVETWVVQRRGGQS
jgi:hypothetical protein